MVRTKGPAISLAARGALGGALVFSENKGRTYVKKLTKPKQPQTAAQLGQRAITAWLAKVWNDQPGSSHDTWIDLAAAWHLPPYQAYLKFNLARWTTFLTPTLFLPLTPALLPAITPTVTPTARLRTILLTPGYATINANAGFIFHHSLSPAMTATKSNAIATVTVKSALSETYVHGPLASGTHYYRATPFAVAGTDGPPSITAFAVIP